MKIYFFFGFFVLIAFTSCTFLLSVKSDTDRTIDLRHIDINGTTYKSSVPEPGFNHQIIQPGQKRAAFFTPKDRDNDEVRLILNVEYLPLQTATERAFINFDNNIKENSIIAVLNVASPENPKDGEYVVDLITSLLAKTNKFVLVDRHSLDLIRTEQQFQLSGDVDDNTAVSIGKMIGANIVITGTIRYIPYKGIGNIGYIHSYPYTAGTRQLVLKAMDVRTAQIIAMASEM